MPSSSLACVLFPSQRRHNNLSGDNLGWFGSEWPQTAGTRVRRGFCAGAGRGIFLFPVTLATAFCRAVSHVIMAFTMVGDMFFEAS
jgi:hypothetical protein